jgi:hypothetical protein
MWPRGRIDRARDILMRIQDALRYPQAQSIEAPPSIMASVGLPAIPQGLRGGRRYGFMTIRIIEEEKLIYSKHSYASGRRPALSRVTGRYVPDNASMAHRRTGERSAPDACETCL